MKSLLQYILESRGEDYYIIFKMTDALERSYSKIKNIAKKNNFIFVDGGSELTLMGHDSADYENVLSGIKKLKLNTTVTVDIHKDSRWESDNITV